MHYCVSAEGRGAVSLSEPGEVLRPRILLEPLTCSGKDFATISGIAWQDWSPPQSRLQTLCRPALPGGSFAAA